jgi:hypothetical protein
MSERRRTSRAPLDVYMNKYVEGIPYMARASEISPDSVSLAHLIEPRHQDNRVGLQFQLPGSGEVIYAEGEVVRQWKQSNHEGSVVRFTLIADRHRKLIDAFVERSGL